MTLLQALLHVTNFKSPLLANAIPCTAAAFAIQAAFAAPSIAGQTERFYDFSGAITYLGVTALSLYLPALRARHAAAASGAAQALPLPSLLSPFLGGAAGAGAAFDWRQVVLSGAVALWAVRLGSFLFQRVLQEGHDSRFDQIRREPAKFLGAFAIQAAWVSLCLMPVVAVNAVPAPAFAAAAASGGGSLLLRRVMDLLGLSMYAGGLLFEVVADRQKAAWMAERRQKLHDEEFLTRGLWAKSRHPNYFGESTLWTGVATVSAGVLLARPVQAALGLGAGAPAALALCYVSPAFVTFLLLKVSGVPLSEAKYDAKFGDRKEYRDWKRNTPMFFPKLW